ncbi:protein of unknown function [Candidatus Nitrospira inopinata]|uniref:Uncharacterized protein n=1 Tax=Candidatus Nitrospira inopinata TaxID=1715989 RepID=A0A0S4KS84_9BACT|nr:protein of unknown function [Candidatus Nitrospira inopinata]
MSHYKNRRLGGRRPFPLRSFPWSRNASCAASSVRLESRGSARGNSYALLRLTFTHTASHTISASFDNLKDGNL